MISTISKELRKMALQTMYPDRFYYVFRIGDQPDLEEYESSARIIKLSGLRFRTVESAIIHILSVKEYRDLPKTINLNYKEYIFEPVPLEDIIRLFRTSIAITTKRLGRGYESIRINFRIAEPISSEFSQYLKNAGVDNLTPTPSYWGYDLWCKSVENIIVGFQEWPEYLIRGNSSLDICEIPSSTNNVELTPRQKEISKLIINRGYSNKEIAKHLKISESAVKVHVGHLLKKHGLKNRTQLSRAMSGGLTHK